MAIFDEIKSIASVLQEAGKIEQYRQILEVQSQLLQMQNDLGKISRENYELKEKLRTKENIVFQNNVYWTKGTTGEMDGPFCSRCWDKNRDLLRAQPISETWFQCPECKTQFDVGSTRGIRTHAATHHDDHI